MCKNQLAAASAYAERRTAPTIGDIFRQYGAAYRRKFAARMSRDQLQVMTMMERCRTGQLGAALYRCDACGVHQQQLNRPNPLGTWLGVLMQRPFAASECVEP